MAETAPLSAAHAHARKAAEETRDIHWEQAAVEHEAAARKFSKAARSTSDSEALRILKLLENQHIKLARIIKSEASSLSDVNRDAQHETHSPQAPPSHPTATKSTTQPAATARPQVTGPTSALAAARVERAPRDASPSLARDIASRRGIPQQIRNPPSPAAQARARQLSPESHRRARSKVTPQIPPSIVESQASLQSQQPRRARTQDDDEGFAKFYSNLTTGTMSKLSSVLAYAGLPLTADDVKAEPSRPIRKPDGRTVRASQDINVEKIFSPAALKAIEDEHRQRGTLGHGFGPAESFYVVPPTGMTTSYLDMARGKRAGSNEEEEEDFVDAREAPGPPSPRHSRSAQNPNKRSSFGNPRTGEELELENTTLKATLEQLAGRLANFEAHAQDASMAALTQSMASVRPIGAGGASPDPSLIERVRWLEQQVEKDAEDKQRLEGLAADQEKALRKWNARYAKLREGAKEKQRVKIERAEKGADEVGGADFGAPATPEPM